jgi:predicted extracellular nuclease
VLRRFALVLGLFFACGEPTENPDGGVADGGADPDAGVTPVQVRVATYNVHLFFDTVCASGNCTSTSFEQASTQQAFDARAAELAAAITRLEADVVLLEEVETQACLDALTQRLAGVMPYGALGEIGTAGSVDVAIVSRTPLFGVVGHRNLTRLERPDGSRTNFSREFLEAHTRVSNGSEVVAFAAHFRSKSSPDDPGRRLAEAQVARQVVQGVAATLPDALVVMGGDLNDTPGSPPIDALTLDGGLLRAAADLPVADQYTYIYNGQGEAIDHLFLAETRGARLLPRSAKVWKDGRGFAGSDHAALSANFELR